MDKLLEITPIILLAIGQILQSRTIIQQQKEIDTLWELPKKLLEGLEEDPHGTEE